MECIYIANLKQLALDTRSSGKQKCDLEETITVEEIGTDRTNLTKVEKNGLCN